MPIWDDPVLVWDSGDPNHRWDAEPEPEPVTLQSLHGRETSSNPSERAARRRRAIERSRARVPYGD